MFSEISRHLLDIFHNSAEAKATRVSIRIYSNKCAGLLTVEVADNGTGIAKSDLESVTDPFFTSRQNRITGLGIPFSSNLRNVREVRLKFYLTAGTAFL